MKKFDDLIFEPHPSGVGKIARLEFENGHGISVVQGHLFLIGEYQLNDLFDMAEIFHGEVVTSTNVMEVTKEDITNKMLELQKQ